MEVPLADKSTYKDWTHYSGSHVQQNPTLNLLEIGVCSCLLPAGQGGRNKEGAGMHGGSGGSK